MTCGKVFLLLRAPSIENAWFLMARYVELKTFGPLFNSLEIKKKKKSENKRKGWPYVNFPTFLLHPSDSREPCCLMVLCNLQSTLECV